MSSLDIKDIDTQKTLQKVIEGKKPIEQTISELSKILLKYNHKSKLAEIEKDICDYIDRQKNDEEMRNNINKPKIFMEDGKVIHVEHGNNIITIGRPFSQIDGDSDSDDECVCNEKCGGSECNEKKYMEISITDNTIHPTTTKRKKIMEQKLYETLSKYFPNIKLKYNGSDLGFRTVYNYRIIDSETRRMIRKLKIDNNCQFVENGKRCTRHLSQFANYCSKHNKSFKKCDITDNDHKEYENINDNFTNDHWQLEEIPHELLEYDNGYDD